eukprot:SAG22_NODE_9056_length_612_cov_1.510721_1_plen_67_part_10
MLAALKAAGRPLTLGFILEPREQAGSDEVSHKALPLPCVSTVFPSKTVPFLVFCLSLELPLSVRFDQ